MTYLDEKIRERLKVKLRTLNSYRPLPKFSLLKIREQFKIEMTYNSNAIEGNSLTLKETYLVINEGITIKGKPLKDHLEAKNHKAALEYLYDLIDKDKKHTVSEMLIRNLHQIIIQKTDKEWAGRYRNANVIIGGADHTPPDASQVPQKMHDLITWLNSQKNKLNIIEL